MAEQLTVVMVSMHTSPLAQPGQGDAGGMNVYVRNLSQALVAAGHQVLAFTRKTSASDVAVMVDSHTDSHVVPVSAGRLDLPKEALSGLTTQFADQMVQEIQQRAQHRVVIHSHYWLSGIAGIQTAHRLGAPLIHTMHTLGAAKNSSAPASEPAYRIERESYIATAATLLVANTAIEKRELIEHTGVAPERVAVVPPGVDHDVFTDIGPAQWPGKQGPDALRVLFAGRMQQFKAPHVLVEALAVLRDRGHQRLPVVHFTGAESGRQHYDVRARAALLGVAQQCSFSPPVSPSVLADYMRAADVVAVPSVAESFGLVALEAQACGTPVIAHRAGGLEIVVADQHTGQLINDLTPRAWADAFEAVIAQPGIWEAYGLAGVDYAKRFSWPIMAQRMVELYRRAQQHG